MIENLTPAQATVISAIISGIIALAVSIINSRSQNKKIMEELRQQAVQKGKDEAVRDAKIEMRLESMERKLEAHNSYAEKLGEIQTDIAVIKNDIKTLYKQG